MESVIQIVLVAESAPFIRSCICMWLPSSQGDLKTQRWTRQTPRAVISGRMRLTDEEHTAGISSVAHLLSAACYLMISLPDALLSNFNQDLFAKWHKTWEYTYHRARITFRALWEKKRKVIFTSMTEAKLPKRKHFYLICFHTHTNICKFCSAAVWIWRKRWRNITWWNCHDSNWLEIDLVLRFLIRKVAQQCIMLFFIILAVYLFSVLL